jgi:hypothetical protein
MPVWPIAVGSAITNTMIKRFLYAKSATL